MPVNINRSSRLQLADLKLIDGFTFWDLLDLPDYVSQDGDIVYTVQDKDRLDTLAERFYGGDAVLWWVIAWANNIERVPIDVVPNMKLIIPDIRYVRRLLATKKF